MSLRLELGPSIIVSKSMGLTTSNEPNLPNNQQNTIKYVWYVRYYKKTKTCVARKSTGIVLYKSHSIRVTADLLRYLRKVGAILSTTVTLSSLAFPSYRTSRMTFVSDVTHEPALVVGIPRWYMACVKTNYTQTQMDVTPVCIFIQMLLKFKYNIINI